MTSGSLADVVHEADAASEAAAVALVERFYEELYNRENRAVVDALMAPDVTLHDPLVGSCSGSQAFKQLHAVYDLSFPGHRITVRRVLVDGEYVTVMHTHHMTHGGDFVDLAPTGCAVRMHGLDLLRVVGGQIVELWRYDDDAGLLRQLGLVESPAAAAPEEPREEDWDRRLAALLG